MKKTKTLTVRSTDKGKLSSMKKFRYLTPNEREALSVLVKSLKEQLQSQLINAWLFGSKAKGNFNSDSDIDVLLILQERTEEILDKIAAIHLELDLKYDPNISLIIYSQHEYEQNEAFESPFLKNIQRESIAL